MELVVEDGTGLPTANSLVSIEDADLILEPNIHSTWATFDDEKKKKLLVWSTNLICQRARWKGTKRYETARLPFPRTGLRDADGSFYPDDEVPAPAKEAVATLADFLATGDPTQPNTSSNVSRLDVDVISLQFDVNTTPERWPSSIGIILRDIATISFGKTGGKRIIKH
jgi:hypothetical protein